MPVMLLEDGKRRGESVQMFVSQPRRAAARALFRRVSEDDGMSQHVSFPTFDVSFLSCFPPRPPPLHHCFSSCFFFFFVRVGLAQKGLVCKLISKRQIKNGRRAKCHKLMRPGVYFKRVSFNRLSTQRVCQVLTDCTTRGVLSLRYTTMSDSEESSTKRQR